MTQCEFCQREITTPNVKLCSLVCMQEFAALRGRLLGATTFKSVLGKLADALAEYRRAVLVAGTRSNFAPTEADQMAKRKIRVDVAEGQYNLFKAAIELGDMISKVRSPGSSGSKDEGEEVKRAVAVSFNNWLSYLEDPNVTYPNDFFTAVAMAIASFMAGRGSVNEEFKNVLDLLRNYSQYSLNTAQEKTYRREFVKGSEEIGARLDKAYSNYADSLKKKGK